MHDNPIMARDIAEFAKGLLEYLQGLLIHKFYETPYIGEIIMKLPLWAYGVFVAIVAIVVPFILYHTLVTVKRSVFHAVANSAIGDAMEKKKTLKYAARLARDGQYMQASDIYASVGDKLKAAKVLEKGNMLDKAGKMYEKLGDLDKAIELYEKAGENTWLADALRLKGDHARAADLLLRMGKKLMAAESFVKCGKHLQAGELFQQSGNLSSAAESYEQAGEFKRAAQCYEQAYVEGTSSQELPSPELKVKLDNMIMKAADYYARTGDYLKSASTYARVKQYIQAGEAAVKGGDRARAAEYFKLGKSYERAADIFKQGGDSQAAADIMAQKYIEARDYAKAGRMFLEAGSFLKAADFFSQGGELASAADAFMQAGEYQSAAELYQAVNDLPKAGAAFEKAGMLSKAAEVYLELGEVDRASALVERSGDFVLAAELYRKQENDDKELSALQKVGTDDHRYNEAVGRMGEIFKKKGNMKLAIEKYMQAIGGADPNQFNLTLFYGLASVYEADGSYDLALNGYSRIQLVDFGFRDVGERIKECEKLAAQPRQGRQASQPGAQPAAAPDASAPAAGVPAPQAQQPQAAPAQDPSQDAAKRYAIIKEVGRGGMGVVYQAKDKHLNRVIALKVLPRHISENPKMVKRFAVEARSAAQLTHTNIVTLYDFQQAGGRSFITMEFVDGVTLKNLMVKTERLPIINVLKIIYQCCQGLDYAHKKGIIHRDIKPSNIMINKQNVIKIMDFGLAKVAGEETLTDAGSLSGTVMYMSPEQLLGDKLDQRTDLYALGMMFYEMVTGKHPFAEGDMAYHHVHTQAKPPKEVRADVPDKLSEIIMKCIDKDRDKRYQSAAQLAMALREVPLKKEG